MRTYMVYRSYNEYFIFNRKTGVLKKELEDFDYVGYLEVDTNHICSMNIRKTSIDEFLSLVDKILEVNFSRVEKVRVNRIQMVRDYEEK